MAKPRPRETDHRFHPLTKERWPDFEKLFGKRGACGGCWCMWWRLTRSEFERGKGEPNRRAMKRLVESGEVPGLLAYRGDEPVGWCSVAPREAYSSLLRSRILRPVDDRAVWSAVCFFVAGQHRRQGLTVELLQAACSHARKHGAGIVEGYPIEPRRGKLADAFAWVGLASAFERAGFVEVLRRSPTRPIMRRALR